MTPKEKAKELIEKFESSFNEHDDGAGVGYGSNAKNNALITVDEILVEHDIYAAYASNPLQASDFTRYLIEEKIGFWKDVRMEIEKAS